jgi:hypothetical protein
VDHLLQKQVGHTTARMTSHYSLQGAEDVRQALTSPMQQMDIEVTAWPIQVTASTGR